MIDGYVEETLLLVGVEVHCHETVDAGYTQEVGHQFCANAHAGFALAVLTSPAKVGNHSANAAG